MAKSFNPHHYQYLRNIYLDNEISDDLFRIFLNDSDEFQTNIDESSLSDDKKKMYKELSTRNIKVFNIVSSLGSSTNQKMKAQRRKAGGSPEDVQQAASWTDVHTGKILITGMQSKANKWKDPYLDNQEVQLNGNLDAIKKYILYYRNKVHQGSFDKQGYKPPDDHFVNTPFGASVRSVVEKDADVKVEDIKHEAQMDKPKTIKVVNKLSDKDIDSFADIFDGDYKEELQRLFEGREEVDMDSNTTSSRVPDYDEITSLTLQEHQKSLNDYFKSKDKYGMLVMHETGTGKTLSALIAAELFLKTYEDSTVTIVAPPGILSHFKSELLKIKGINDKKEKDALLKLAGGVRNVGYFGKYYFWSYVKYLNFYSQHPDKVKKFCKNNLLIIDEVHNLRNYQQSTKGGKMKYSKIWLPAMTCANYSRKRLVLTATPFINKLSDFVSIINFIYGQMAIGSKSEHENGLVYDFIMENEESLEKIMNLLKSEGNRFIDYVPLSPDNKNFANARQEYIIQPMTELFKELYRKEIGKTSKKNATDISVDDSKADTTKKDLFKDGPSDLGIKWKTFEGPGAFYSTHRQAVNNIDIKEEDYVNTKFNNDRLKSLFEVIKSEKQKTIIYTNFIEQGLIRIQTVLTGGTYKVKNEDTGEVDTITYDGFGFNKKQVLTIYGKVEDKQAVVNTFNNNPDKLVLIITQAGSEGLDIKPKHQNGDKNGVQNIIILDPVWNPATLKQIIGRGIRYGSHNEGEVVNVYKLILTTLTQDKIPPFPEDESEEAYKEYRTQLRNFLIEDVYSGDAILYRILEKKIDLQNHIYDMIAKITDKQLSKQIEQHSAEMADSEKLQPLMKKEAEIIEQIEEVQEKFEFEELD